jgi:hypothetical protein
MKLYGDTFLTKPRWFTTDKKKAENSLFIYRNPFDKERPLYRLSIIGVINGLMSKIGLALSVNVYFTGEIKEYKLTRSFKRK